MAVVFVRAPLRDVVLTRKHGGDWWWQRLSCGHVLTFRGLRKLGADRHRCRKCWYKANKTAFITGS